MKYELDTIPVWDALKEDTECLLCHLQHRAEDSALRFFMGDSVMMPEFRVQINAKGFRPETWVKLLGERHKQGLALMASTYLPAMDKRMADAEKELLAQAEELNSKKELGKLFADKHPIRKSISKLRQHIAKELSSDPFVEMVEASMKRYAYTLGHLLVKDTDFAQQYQGSKGLCLPHLDLVLETLQETLSPVDLGRAVKIILEVQDQNFQRLEEEILWFTQMFKAENQGKDWGTSKDSLPRVVQKLSAHYEPPKKKKNPYRTHD
jgi:hypothetical protein